MGGKSLFGQILKGKQETAEQTECKYATAEAVEIT